MPARLTLAEVRQKFADAGCTMVSDEYRSNKRTLIQYRCSCGSPTVHSITVSCFQAGLRCPDCRGARCTATVLARFGVTHVSKIPEVRERALAGILKYVNDKRYTLEEAKEIVKQGGCELLSDTYVSNTTPMPIRFACGCEGPMTLARFLQGQRCATREHMTERKVATSLERFNVDWYRQTEEYHVRHKTTCLATYGVEHTSQCPEVHSRSVRSAFLTKQFRFPVSGRVVSVRGYEGLAITHLLAALRIDEADFEVDPLSMPADYWYDDDAGKKHRYFPDIWIARLNLIVEVKSTYTLEIARRVVELKHRSVELAGQAFVLMVMDAKGALLNPEELSSVETQLTRPPRGSSAKF